MLLSIFLFNENERVLITNLSNYRHKMMILLFRHLLHKFLDHEINSGRRLPIVQ